MAGVISGAEAPLPENTARSLENIFSRMKERFGLRKNLEVEVGAIGEEEIRELNREYRGKDESTDVLSFPLEPSDHENWLGAIYFCPQVVGKKYEDLEFGFSFLFIHSLLHLMGYEHGEEMTRLQEEMVEALLG